MRLRFLQFATNALSHLPSDREVLCPAGHVSSPIDDNGASCARMSRAVQGNRASRGAGSGPPLPLPSMIGFTVAVVAVVLIAWFSFDSLQSRASTSERVTQTITMISRMQAVLSSVKDAETGQRGYLLTGAERYLEPYTQPPRRRR